jgi:hypothetical protein
MLEMEAYNFTLGPVQDMLRLVSGMGCVHAEANGMTRRIWSGKHVIAYFGRKFQSVSHFKYDRAHSE